MMRSMFAGVSGLKTHQVRMDIIGNNIANVNSAGYKSSRATFQEMLSQTMRGASAPADAKGGTNPQQIGLGVQLGSIDVKHTQGNTQSTGYLTDLAIEGEGFFILGQGANRQYTRAGMFGLDNGTEGNLVSLVNGARVLGYKADQNGIIDLNTTLEPLYISASETITPRATDTVYFAGNLDNRYSTGQVVGRTVQVYDSRGREHTVTVDLKKLQDNAWEWDANWLMVSDAVPMHENLISNNGKYIVYSGGPGLEMRDVLTGQVVADSTDGRLWTSKIVSGDGPTFEFDAALQAGADVKAMSDGGYLFLTSELSLTKELVAFTPSIAPVSSYDGNNSRLEVGSRYEVTGDADAGLRLLDRSGNLVATSLDGVVWVPQVADSSQPAPSNITFARALTAGTTVAVSGTTSSDLTLTATNIRDFNPTIPAAERAIDFNRDGSYAGVGQNQVSFAPTLSERVELTFDFSDFTMYADTFTGKFLGQNGYTSGSLESYAIDQNGVIVGSFSNGLTRALGQVALARFANPAGLERSGSTMFVDTPNSGQAQVGAAGIPGYGQISPSALEMSNVDLSQEFTEMIITQRGFQANSRIITTSDEMLQELVNLKR